MTIEQTFQETAARPASIAGRWRNRLGSVMEVAVGDDDVVTGWFRTGVGGDGAQHEHPLTGFVRGDAVVFCVDFRPHGSLSAWAGHHVVDGGPERLVTLWHLARPVPQAHAEVDLWQGLLAGADQFERDA
jgi:hypothetical protein